MLSYRIIQIVDAQTEVKKPTGITLGFAASTGVAVAEMPV